MIGHKSVSCLICGHPELFVVERFGALPRITSDCRPFAAGGELCVCGGCGTIQKLPNQRWLEEIAWIYEGYAAYGLAGGEEQLVLDVETGRPRKRSEVLMRELLRTGALPAFCKAIDVGCGHGVTMRAMGTAFPGWQLFGHELGVGNVAILAAIPRFRRLYTGDLAKIDERFGFVSMIHSLEHFVDPLTTLRSLRDKISHDGHLFVEVCNVDENPFDLLVADHLMHFSPSSLKLIVNRAGFGAIQLETGWVKKEISLLATSEEVKFDNTNLLPQIDPMEVRKSVEANVGWLERLINKARTAAAESTKFGLFGTSIAASWLAAQLGDQVNFFVEEDPNRAGKQYMGRPVFLPSEAPVSSVVFMSLAPALASAIRARLSSLPLAMIEPPLLNEH